MALLKKGLSGAPVRRLQEKLGVKADGVFGPATEKALKDYQTEHGLSADGIAGPDTFTAMGMPELVLLMKGSKGEAVKRLQEALGIKADGQFGPGTEQAVKAYQESKGLKVDGIAGPATLATLDAFPDIDEKTVSKGQLSDADLGDDVAPEAKELVQSEAAGGSRSIWSTIKGIFG